MDDFELSIDPRGGMTLRRPDEDDVAGVSARRAFPWTNPDRNISIRSSEGKELLLIERLSDLPAGQRALVEGWLARHSFVPRITRVLRINVDFGYQQWQVETDRGPIEFRVQEREDIRFLHDGRYLVKDADGSIYELPRQDALDADSRKVLQALL